MFARKGKSSDVQASISRFTDLNRDCVSRVKHLKILLDTLTTNVSFFFEFVEGKNHTCKFLSVCLRKQTFLIVLNMFYVNTSFLPKKKANTHWLQVSLTTFTHWLHSLIDCKVSLTAICSLTALCSLTAKSHWLQFAHWLHHAHWLLSLIDYILLIDCALTALS